MTIAQKLKIERTARKYTQQELADQIGVSRQLVSRWENGVSIPDAQQLEQLSKLFHLSLDAWEQESIPEVSSSSEEALQIHIPAVNTQYLIIILLSLGSFLLYPFGIIAGMLNFIYTIMTKQNKWIILIVSLIMLYQLYSVISLLFPSLIYSISSVTKLN